MFTTLEVINTIVATLGLFLLFKREQRESNNKQPLS